MNKRLVKKVMAACTAGAIAGALVLIPALEGVRYEPYQDVAGVWTVCAGITGSDVIQGKKYTQKECDDLLVKHMQPAIRAVDTLVKVPLNDYQKVSLYSLTYNIGVAAFKKSTLLKKLNAGDQVGACNELRRWIYAGGVKWNGLVTRREIERELCMME
ncbi:lysozyme [Morganella morganii subsp. morganii]|uniref:lysozyme n=1 Tax=Morganella morganii TaxID=582 RepID=UPI001BDB4545|nr:lysozyme [Morganella morganii]MBT0435155.1 lysozyme [Morganella morganii subsp. morganii]